LEVALNNNHTRPWLGTVQCSKGCKLWVTRLCTGQPGLSDDGAEHLHCAECPGPLGACVTGHDNAAALRHCGGPCPWDHVLPRGCDCSWQAEERHDRFMRGAGPNGGSSSSADDY
jgi:hypothetical protein